MDLSKGLCSLFYPCDLYSGFLKVKLTKKKITIVCLKETNTYAHPQINEPLLSSSDPSILISFLHFLEHMWPEFRYSFHAISFLPLYAHIPLVFFMHPNM